MLFNGLRFDQRKAITAFSADVPSQMSYKLYIDDLRNPPDRSWVVVRSVAAAQEYIETYGFPSFISFDHDLGMKGKILPSGLWVGEETLQPDGYDFAKWLCDQDMETPWMSRLKFSYQVHSSNPVGAANITGYLNNYFEVCVH
ncbi:hypothetical protein D3C87_952970 [compost metagenome]